MDGGGGADGLEGLRSESSQFSASEAKLKGFGSELPEEQKWRATKVLRADDGLPAVKSTTPLHRGTPLMRSDRTLSFSSPRPEVIFLTEDSAGYASLAGCRGLFTPSQWIELEHQAMIYKYLDAKVPVPSNLLIPLRRSFSAYSLSGSSAGPLNPNSPVGWGSFHLGFSGSTDPDIGRCRRTDGKKWRCTREAVADQKYCEKHINRGRHRSRKPVEGQLTGRVAATSGPSNPKMVSMASSSSLVGDPTGGGSDNVCALGQNQFNRTLDLQSQGLSFTSSAVDPKSDHQTVFAFIPDREIPVEDSTRTEFGLISSSCLVNPSLTKSYSSYLDFTDPDPDNHQQSRHQFIDNFPKAQLDSPIITWPEDLKSDWTQLSVSIPVASSDICSSASSPLRPSHELDPFQVDFEQTGNLIGSTSLKQSSCGLISWGPSPGGPLGEVLIRTSTGSSPSGVPQQNGSFGSQSNSSSGSSPITENPMARESLSLCDDVLCSTIAVIP